MELIIVIGLVLIVVAVLDDRRFCKAVRPDYGLITRLEHSTGLVTTPARCWLDEYFEAIDAPGQIIEYQAQPYKVGHKHGMRYHYYEDGRIVAMRQEIADSPSPSAQALRLLEQSESLKMLYEEQMKMMMSPRILVPSSAYNEGAPAARERSGADTEGMNFDA